VRWNYYVAEIYVKLKPSKLGSLLGGPEENSLLILSAPFSPVAVCLRPPLGLFGVVPVVFANPFWVVGCPLFNAGFDLFFMALILSLTV
jgi:hypothetical protein